MSTNLYWRAPSKPRYLGKGIKYAIAPEWWGHDGTLGSPSRFVGAEDVSFLREVAARGDDQVRAEAEKLIALVERHGVVEVWLES